MLTTTTMTRAAAATAGIALMVTGAAPALAGERHGNADRPTHAQERHAAAHEKKAAGKGRSGDRPTDRGRSAEAPRGKSAEAPSGRTGTAGARGDNGLGDERGNGHTPVTVCHALGNGEYVEITFDENAFAKHLENHMKHMDDHQDYVVEPGTGCETPAPEAADETSSAGEGSSSDDLLVEDVATGTVTEESVVAGAEVLGVEAFAARAAGPAQVAGAAASAPAAGFAAAPVAGPMAGILPQTGAAPMALAAAAGLGLLGAGATLVARRRREL